MLSRKDYSQMTLEELVSEEQKIKSQNTTTAIFIGVILGIAVYAATHKGFILTIILLISALLIGHRHSENMKRIQAEISRRG